MLADQILARKGRDVATIRPDATVGDAVAELRRWNVGALVVSDDGVEVAGVVSERDVVRRLADEGAGALARPVADVMVRDVVTCDARTSSAHLMGVMTERRVRHVPVVESGKLAGIVSIGDVVKTRVDELVAETKQLVEYIQNGR